VSLPPLELRYGLTNAAFRTTPGSGDLRRADFAGSEARLEQIALKLRPSWIAFVGKEAYRGVFNERPEFGAQQRRLGLAKLFVLPSTSPANAAVPWAERLRWFQELGGRVTGLPLREGVRAVVVDPTGKTLLLEFVVSNAGSFWASPGGGVESAPRRLAELLRDLLDHGPPAEPLDAGV